MTVPYSWETANSMKNSTAKSVHMLQETAYILWSQSAGAIFTYEVESSIDKYLLQNSSLLEYTDYVMLFQFLLP